MITGVLPICKKHSQNVCVCYFEHFTAADRFFVRRLRSYPSMISHILPTLVLWLWSLHIPAYPVICAKGGKVYNHWSLISSDHWSVPQFWSLTTHQLLIPDPDYWSVGHHLLYHRYCRKMEENFTALTAPHCIVVWPFRMSTGRVSMQFWIGMYTS